MPPYVLKLFLYFSPNNNNKYTTKNENPQQSEDFLCIYVLMILHESPHRLLYKTEKTYLIIPYPDLIDKILFSIPILYSIVFL